MARYRVVRWQEIPSVVEAWDAGETVRIPLSQRFQDLIDGVAMRQGADASDAYLDGWRQDADEERTGSAEAVAQAVAAELEASFVEVVQRYLR